MDGFACFRPPSSLTILIKMRFTLTTALLFAGAALATCKDSCKAYPDTPSWPSKHAWNKLNAAVDGRLFKPVPPGGVCHEEQPNYDEEECPAVQQLWTTYDWHTHDPVSIQWDNWANFTCLPDPEKPCSGDGYPAYVVNATSAEHVKATVDFGKPLKPANAK